MNPKAKRWLKILLSAAAVTVLCLIFRDNYEEIIGTISGYLIAIIGTELLTALIHWREDKKKIASRGFRYNRDYYCHLLKIGDKTTEIWYDPIVATQDVTYKVHDDSKKYFKLDPILQQNFSSIIHAHDASFIANPLMVRLDDCELKDGVMHLYTSRTAYFNDLVTNRSMDYPFEGDITVRELFESGNFLSPLNESKMSNHIGYGAFVFHGDAMILCCRGGTSTISKNKFTAGLAFGLSENELIASHDPLNGKNFVERDPKLNESDLFAGALLVQLAKNLALPLKYLRDCYQKNKIKIHTLGFGQLVYTGGKPQFYFAVVIDEDVDLKKKDGTTTNKGDKKIIDFNKGVAFATDIELLKDNRYTLKLTLRGSKKNLRGEAEKSFFINWLHLLSRPRIAGVPAWVYDKAQLIVPKSDEAEAENETENAENTASFHAETPNEANTQPTAEDCKDAIEAEL